MATIVKPKKTKNKSTKTKKNPQGRPKANVDGKLVYELSKIHCTKDEIATIVGCSVDTLYERFADEMKNGVAYGKRSLRRLQWQSAEKHCTNMLIWLGKQCLGQRDRQLDEVDTQTTYNIVFNEIP